MRRLALARVVVVFGLLFVALGQATPALAEGEIIRGTLTTVVDGETVPVEGVMIIVLQNGVEVGHANSGPDGTWEIPVPGPGEYDVRLDVASLPEGLVPAEPEGVDLSRIRVREGQLRRVVFQLGDGGRSSTATFRQAAAVLVVGLKLGAIIALSAVGLSLVFGVTGLVNFSHAELVTTGAVVAFFFHGVGPRWPLVFAAIPALVFGALLGWAQEKSLWRPLRRKGMGLLSMMVVSIGFGIALRFLILIIFEGLPRAYPDFAGQGAVSVLGIPMVPKQLVTIAVSALLLLAVGLFLQRTQAGTALRAVRDNPDLSESSGINVDRIIALTWTLGATLAAAGGIFFGLTESVQWDMGFRFLLLMFAAVVLGGLGTAYGAMIGGFVVGVAVEMSTLFFPTELKAAVGLGLLIIILIFKPLGLLGVRERIG
jgi:neutral amino acid transport system permease protein